MTRQRSRTERVLAAAAGVVLCVGVAGCSSGGGSKAAPSVTATTGGGEPASTAAPSAVPVATTPATTTPRTTTPATTTPTSAAPAAPAGSAAGTGDFCSLFDLTEAGALAGTTPTQTKGPSDTGSPALTMVDNCKYDWDGGGLAYVVIAYHGIPASMAVAGAKAAANTPGLHEFPVDLGDASYGYTSEFQGKTGSMVVVVTGDESVAVSDNAADAATAQAMALAAAKAVVGKLH